MRILVALFLISLVAGCSFKLGAEKIEMDAKTAKRAVINTVPPTYDVSQRNDAAIRRLAMV